MLDADILHFIALESGEEPLFRFYTSEYYSTGQCVGRLLAFVTSGPRQHTFRCSGA